MWIMDDYVVDYEMPPSRTAKKTTMQNIFLKIQNEALKFQLCTSSGQV